MSRRGRPAHAPGTRGRLCFVTQWFTPERITVARWLADALRDDWDLTVLTGIPNYPEGVVHPGYRASRFSRELVDGIRVRRTPLYPDHGASAAKRMLNYASWALSATIGGQRELRRADVALVYSSPATAALPAMVARLLWRTPYVLQVQDLWPDSIFASGFLETGVVGRLAKSIMGAFTGWSYRLATTVVVICPEVADVLAARGVPRDKIALVYNWVDESVFAPESEGNGRKQPHPGRGSDRDDPPRPAADATTTGDAGRAPELTVMYAGNHGAAQALDTAIRAVARADGVRLVFVGDGVAKPGLERLAQEIAPDKVEFRDPVPLAEMPTVLATADLQLVSLADRPLFRITLPSKVQSIMCSGHPVLASAPGATTTVVERADAGWTAPPEDPAALAAAIAAARDAGPAERRRRGANGRRAYVAEMARSVGARRLSDILGAAAQR